MTFTAGSGKTAYDGDGSTTSFPTGFQFILNNHVKVILRDGNDVEVPWSEGTHYSLAGAGDPGGGTLTVKTAPSDFTPQPGEKLFVVLDVPFNQGAALPLGGAFPSTAVEQALDLLAMGLAKLSEVDRRTLKVPESDTNLGTLDLPIDSARANKFMAFDALGKATTALGTSGDLAPVSTFVNTLLSAADAGSFRALIDAVALAGNNVFTGINSFSKIQKLAHGADVASATTLTLGDDGNSFNITGTTAITAIATKGVGTVVVLRFAAALSLTHDAVDLILPGGADITTAAGDVAAFEEYATGDWRCLFYTRASGAPLVSSDVFSTKLLPVQDERAQNTAGGTLTSGAWRTRTLNTVKTNEIPGASLSSNQVTLQAGTYYAEWSAPSYSVDGHQTRLRNITDGADILLGSTEMADGAGATAHMTRSTGVGRFALATGKVIELQHRGETSLATNGFGRPANFGTEIYSILKIWKLA